MLMMLTASRKRLMEIDNLFPTNGFTADYQHIYIMITEKQYKRAKDLLPAHVIYKLPKKPAHQDKALMTIVKK